MSDTIHLPARLLLVDDDLAQVRLWQTLLRGAFGNRIVIDAMSDPYAALLHARDYSVDILITDLSMPEVCGLDLVRCVKVRNRCAQALLITGASNTEALLESIDAGAVDYLLKPFETQVLVEIVQQAIARLERWRLALAGTLRRTHADPALRA